MIKTILYASDLGALSTYSLAYVEQLAKRFEARIVVLHVVQPIDALAAAVVTSRCSENTKQEVLRSTQHITGLLETVREQAYERLLPDESGMDLSRYLKDIVVRSGRPADAVLAFADEINADMIVVGSCGEDSVGTPMLGSVANRVLQLAKVPVFMVPIHFQWSPSSTPLSDSGYIS